jgi:hypothetical protein
MGLLQASSISGAGIVADLGDPWSMHEALKVLLAELDEADSWTSRRIAAGDPLTPAYGTVLDGVFVEHQEDEEAGSRGNEQRFFAAAARVPELRPWIQAYVQRIVEINRSRRRPVWATDEDPAGTVAAACLAEADARYIPDFVALLESSSDGAQDVYQDHDVSCVLWRWGWNAQTLPLAMDRVAVSPSFLEDHAADVRAYAFSSEASCFAVCTYFAQRFASRYPEDSQRHAYLVNHGAGHFETFVRALLPERDEVARMLGQALHAATLAHLTHPAPVLEVARHIFTMAEVTRPQVLGNRVEQAILAGVRDDQLELLLRQEPFALESANGAGQTPIFTAIQLAPQLGHVAHVLVLLSAGARLDVVDCQGNTPLDFAHALLEHRKDAVLKLTITLLVERGARRRAG